jgi:DNA-binding NtrC family response regulator
VARFKQEPFDLVLTDQRMPDLSGLEVLEAVRSISPETAVVLVTAYGTIETAVRAVQAGAADYLTKPLNLDDLLHRVHRVRERQRLVAENRELREALAERHRVDGIIGDSGRMQEALSWCAGPERCHRADRGESGASDFIARALCTAPGGGPRGQPRAGRDAQTELFAKRRFHRALASRRAASGLPTARLSDGSATPPPGKL